MSAYEASLNAFVASTWRDIRIGVLAGFAGGLTVGFVAWGLV